MTTERVMASGERGAARDPRARRKHLALAAIAVLASPAAWLASLWLSWGVQDFTCSAAASADSDAPAAGLFVILLVMNIVLLVLAALSGVVGWVLARHSRAATQQAESDGGNGESANRPGVLSFLGVTAAVLSLLFCYGIILITANPLVFEVCS
ncbi:hypothetical protein OH146_03230 [Salinibacterium sp. SYSU T00001]|uniref:hypothetical protein n=1 Tax=Homoserinimonas sedimenticola TaxID=2986805 RepID=UPI002235E72E|nr:hypothetical protein [Salinibacterium sedimenticola]MCW4384782.1 hypothetical protein [Salinibacterium sedimenticola]